jgi:hypothetical protein
LIVAGGIHCPQTVCRRTLLLLTVFPGYAVPTPHFTHQPLSRRTALLGAVSLLALPASRLAAAAQPPSAVWPNASQVPGGIARLSLGPAATRPVAHAGELPLLVVGDVIEWTALVGIALAAEPGEASIAVQTAEGGRREIAYTGDQLGDQLGSDSN